MSRKERNYILALFIGEIALVVLAVFSMVYAIVKIGEQGSMNNNFLELLYMGIHIVILVTALIFTKTALDKGSYIMRNLMYSQHGGRSVTAMVIAGILSALGLGTAVYFALVLFGLPLPSWNFPIALLLDLVNSPLTLFYVGIFFLFFPFIGPKMLKKSK